MNKPQSLVSFILPCHPLKGHKETLFIRYTDAERPLMPICPKKSYSTRSLRSYAILQWSRSLDASQPLDRVSTCYVYHGCDSSFTDLHCDLASPSSTVPSKRKHDTVSGSSSPLSPPSRLQSPLNATVTDEVKPARSPSSESSSSSEARQPKPAPSIPQYQTFGPDPMKFDDPTIYEIREIVEGMSEEEKKEIFGVTVYPHDDLSHLIAGTPPDKDFSNAKPTNQVNPNTFAAYLEPYLRPFNEEDTNFLKERVSQSFCALAIVTYASKGRSTDTISHASSRS